MRYWDASALVPLLAAEPSSSLVPERLAEDEEIITCVCCHTEIVSAIERRAREGSLLRPQYREVLRRFDAFASNWDEVTDVFAVRSRANALLAIHPLRAADAGQLGAKMLVQDQLAGPLAFACLDGRLAAAAEAEGLRVLR